MSDSPEKKFSIQRHASGPFRPHGQIDYWIDGPLLRLRAEGPFNLEAMVALGKAMQELLRSRPFQQRPAHLLEWQGSALTTPEALAHFTGFLAQMRLAGGKPVAVAMVMGQHIEGRTFMLPRYTEAYAALGAPFAVFEDVDAGRQWLEHMLQRQAAPS